MRNAELKRQKNKRQLSRYKNNYILSLVIEATRVEFWTDWNINRLKLLRLTLESDYEIPVNFFSAFVYYATYKYMNWNNRDYEYKNYIGFISNSSMLVAFANFVGKKSLLWRKRTSKWPPDWIDKWGIPPSIRTQKLGQKDKLFSDTLLMSKSLDGKINRFL